MRMFGALGSADPVVCEFTADQLRNGWSWSSDASQIAALRDHTADDRAVKDMFNQDVKDSRRSGYWGVICPTRIPVCAEPPLSFWVGVTTTRRCGCSVRR